MIFFKTDLKGLPNSCLECTMFHCDLPMYKSKSRRDEVKDKYIKKRHEHCPLVFVNNSNFNVTKAKAKGEY